MNAGIPRHSSARSDGPVRSPWAHVAQAVAALTVGMGGGEAVETVGGTCSSRPIYYISSRSVVYLPHGTYQ